MAGTIKQGPGEGPCSTTVTWNRLGGGTLQVVYFKRLDAGSRQNHAPRADQAVVLIRMSRQSITAPRPERDCMTAAS